MPPVNTVCVSVLATNRSDKKEFINACVRRTLCRLQVHVSHINRIAFSEPVPWLS
jgi:hypothetical protein